MSRNGEGGMEMETTREGGGGMSEDSMSEGEEVLEYEDSTPLPLDDKCLHGTLSNGLTYYIQNNKKPEARAELRLVVKIGSVYEDDDEQGLAHVVEHLAFRGTALYDTFEVVKYLESIGAKFGACQNAYTAFDETVYEQLIPIDKEGLLEKSLTVLKEWANYIRCSDADVEAERSVVHEEWRQGRSAAGRSDEDYFATLMRGRRQHLSRQHTSLFVIRDLQYHPSTRVQGALVSATS
jgi:zinc protease